MRVILFLLCIALMTTNGLAANITHETPLNTKVDKVKPSKSAKRQVKRQQRLEKWEKRLGGAAAKRQAKAGENGGRGKAIASLVVGILSFFFPMILSFVGIALGFAARTKLKESGARGKGFAIAGIVLSIITLILSLLAFLYLLFILVASSYSYP